jgi:hypothetical protein
MLKFLPDVDHVAVLQGQGCETEGMAEEGGKGIGDGPGTEDLV